MPEIVDSTDDDELWEASLGQSFAAWGGRLSLEQYRALSHAVRGILGRARMRLETFAVVADAGAGGRREVLASCQVLSRPLCCSGGRMAEDHCVSRVFVPEPQRCKGYAAVLVAHAVERYAASPDVVSVWSSSPYFKRFGFRPAYHHVPGNKSIVCTESRALASGCEWLGLDAMPALAKEHARLVSRAVEWLPGPSAYEPQPVCAVMPSAALYKQHQAAAVVVQEMLGGPVPRKFGARTPNGHGWAAWTYDFVGPHPGRLLFLGVSGSANEIAELLAAAAEAAAEYAGMEVELSDSLFVDKDLEIDEILAALEASGLAFNYAARPGPLPLSIGDTAYTVPGPYAYEF